MVELSLSESVEASAATVLQTLTANSNSSPCQSLVLKRLMGTAQYGEVSKDSGSGANSWFALFGGELRFKQM